MNLTEQCILFVNELNEQIISAVKQPNKLSILFVNKLNKSVLKWTERTEYLTFGQTKQSSSLFVNKLNEWCISFFKELVNKWNEESISILKQPNELSILFVNELNKSIHLVLKWTKQSVSFLDKMSEQNISFMKQLNRLDISWINWTNWTNSASHSWMNFNYQSISFVN